MNIALEPTAPLRQVTARNRRHRIGHVIWRPASSAWSSGSMRRDRWRSDGILVERLHSSPANADISTTATR
ncbi:MAG: hypothetical protein A3H97_13205 [Acidobacteria bacterium RIFCSPLOWO2_02_FULL_65_29]|nr:MAG: hypothetical protein A3H97_13205 [Acidobacteria bacterium RIFCSPLOWO2_02_FULL_65_29]